MIVYRLWTTNRARKKLDLFTTGYGSPILVRFRLFCVCGLNIMPPLPQEAMTIFVESAALYRFVVLSDHDLVRR